MAAQASKYQINQFVGVVDKFMQKYAALISPETQARVYGTGDQALINRYEKTINDAGRLRGHIIETVGAWQKAKATYNSMIDKTSMVIGDAIDEIRSWFGYDPAPGIGCAPNTAVTLRGLGAIQLPAAALAAVWITGIIAAAVSMNKIIDQVMIQIQAAQIMRSNTGISKADALKLATKNVESESFFEQLKLPLVLAAVVGAVYFARKK